MFTFNCFLFNFLFTIRALCCFHFIFHNKKLLIGICVLLKIQKIITWPKVYLGITAGQYFMG